MTSVQEPVDSLRQPVTPLLREPGGAAAPQSHLRLVLVLGALIALGPLTIDTYLPALPTIAGDLRTTDTAAQLTLTGTLAGLGLGQLFLGPLSDAVGRRRPLLAGTAVHVLASLLCLVAPNILVLGAARVLQGLGAAAASVIAVAMVRDLTSGTAAARLLSRLILVMGVAPVLAPSLGGALLRYTNWRGVFVALAVLGLALIGVAVFGLRESLPPERRRSDGVLGTLRVYRALLRDPIYLGLVFVAGLAMSALFAYVSGSSFVFQEEYGLSQQQFALVFSSGAVGLIGATQLNVRLLRRYRPQQILGSALLAGMLAAAALFAVAATGVGGMWALLVCLWAVLTACGLALPNAPALALAGYGEAAGTAAALLGALQFGVGAVSSPVVGALGSGSVGMAGTMLGAMALASGLLLLVARTGRLELLDTSDAGAAGAH
ncbi:multidrug effflux MFS transporter [Micromonospora sp. NPDC049559]|uniref:multidrug effflux MFS transporter n=1 Tax=Micromonospora sp. NPDC049559 TaxID=3155923 RepID=UPI003447EE0A